LKEKLGGLEQAGGDLPAELKQKLKTEIEGLVQKMVGDQGKVFAFVESEVVTDGNVRKIEKAGQPQVLMMAKAKGAEGELPNRIAALEKASRMLKETGNPEMAGRLWEEAQALKGKLAKPPQGDMGDKIAALEKESRAMKEAGQHDMAEKLWDKAQALKAKGHAGKPEGPDDKLVRTLRELQDQITDLRNEVRALKERAGK
jgi:hypothetical protein